MLDPDLFSLGPRRVKAFADRHGADISAGVAAVHTFGRLPIPDDLDAVAFTPPEREIFKEFLEEEALSLYT